MTPMRPGVENQDLAMLGGGKQVLAWQARPWYILQIRPGMHRKQASPGVANKTMVDIANKTWHGKCELLCHTSGKDVT